MKHQIFIVDDHSVMRWGYISLINQEPDLEVCGEAGSALEALDKLETTPTDLVIVDISLEGMDGIELTKQLNELYPELGILVVSMHDEALYAERALRAGARGYIMKKQARTSIVEAIRRILSGGFHLSHDTSTKILFQYQGRRSGEEQSSLERLSDREIEIFELFGRGLSTREVAEMVNVSPKTVETYRRRIKEKLAIDSTAELIRMAVLHFHGKS